MRPFQAPGNQDSTLDRKAYFVIDGQQRMQTLYIGLKGSYETKILYFNLLSNGKEEFEFAFADDEKRLPKPEKDEWGKEKANLWYSVPTLYQKFYRENQKSHERRFKNHRISQYYQYTRR